MLATGKCWLRVVYKYGLWSPPTAIPACHVEGLFCVPCGETSEHAHQWERYNRHQPASGGGIYLPSHTTGAFVWDSSQSSLPTERMVRTVQNMYPEDWNVFELVSSF
jgi:hypothetical protein